jgi:hypothetical protein
MSRIQLDYLSSSFELDLRADSKPPKTISGTGLDHRRATVDSQTA